MPTTLIAGHIIQKQTLLLDYTGSFDVQNHVATKDQKTVKVLKTQQTIVKQEQHTKIVTEKLLWINRRQCTPVINRAVLSLQMFQIKYHQRPHHHPLQQQ